MAKLHLTKRSLRDIQEIFDYSAKKFGITVAEKYLTQIEDALLFVKNNSQLIHYRPEISYRFKVYRCEKHWLIFDLVGEDLYLLTVKHTSQDLLTKLKLLEPSLEKEVNALYQQIINQSNSNP